MSVWTYITATLVLGGPLYNIANDEFDKHKYILDKLLQNKIKGSEGSASIFINKPKGYLMSDNKDKYGSKYIVTIFGNLRDKTVDETMDELDAIYAPLGNIGFRIFVDRCVGCMVDSMGCMKDINELLQELALYSSITDIRKKNAK